MNDFLRKLGFICDMQIEVDALKSDFVRVFRDQVDDDDLGLMSDTLDVFKSSKNDFKGKINDSGFVIKRRRRFFSNRMNYAKAHGFISQEDDKLVIDVEVNAFHKMFYVWYLIIPLFYVVAITTFLATGEADFVFPVFFLIFHALFMLGLPFFMMRAAASRFAKALEREFVYIAAKGK
ncbi:MAG: hypothetical protein AAF740_14285 [Bacteroidota bacterium]